MPGAVWIPKRPTGSSSHSTRPRVTAWESDYPSVARSSRVITAEYGVNQTKVRERPSHFLSLVCPRVRLVSAILTPLGHLPGRRREVSSMTELSLVSVVDDDESVRESLPDLLREFGYAVKAFASAEEFLASDCIGRTRCLILDIAMPGMSGPDLQRELTLAGRRFRSSSSPRKSRPPVRACSNRARWSVLTNHLATRLCSARSMLLFG